VQEEESQRKTNHYETVSYSDPQIGSTFIVLHPGLILACWNGVSVCRCVCGSVCVLSCMCKSANVCVCAWQHVFRPKCGPRSMCRHWHVDTTVCLWVKMQMSVYSCTFKQTGCVCVCLCKCVCTHSGGVISQRIGVSCHSVLTHLNANHNLRSARKDSSAALNHFKKNLLLNLLLLFCNQCLFAVFPISLYSCYFKTHDLSCLWIAWYNLPQFVCLLCIDMIHICPIFLYEMTVCKQIDRMKRVARSDDTKSAAPLGFIRSSSSLFRCSAPTCWYLLTLTALVEWFHLHPIKFDPLLYCIYCNGLSDM